MAKRTTVCCLILPLLFSVFLVACNEHGSDSGTSPSTDPEIPGGPGEAYIGFTYVPPVGSFENLEGEVLHVSPSDYRVAVYIYVNGWWTKPTFSQPLTSIRSNGNWSTDITTGGDDEQATRIAAYLLPEGYSPPLLSGGASLPAELDQNAAAKVEASRNP